MSPSPTKYDLSSKRAQYAGPSGFKGIIHNGKTSAIAFFASLGGFVYGCKLAVLSCYSAELVTDNTQTIKECLHRS